jgi:glycosyltransferase involved in cell wall biosynthesis
MGIEVNEISEKSNGGTELMLRGLQSRLDPELIKDIQIIPSRVRQLDEDKIRILWLHDLPGDPESEHLKDGGHNRFHLLVFVSNWQMQQYIQYYGIPWSKCVVIENVIESISSATINKPADKIKLIYHTTPHRGLEILVPVFEKLCEQHSDIELDVFSSFKIYGWEQRDEPYQQLFQRCKDHPQINYHGTVPNIEVRKAVAQAHIFAYPSIWLETSCLSLMEAMSAECVCIHPNFGALHETAGGTTVMYQWNETPNEHAGILYAHLESVIKALREKNEALANVVKIQKSYADLRYSWNRVMNVWHDILTGIKQRYPDKESRGLPQAVFHYRVS